MNHPAGLLNVRRIAVLAFSLLMALALTTAVATDHAGAKKNKKAKVTIKKVKTKNQAALLNTKKLAVKVKSTGKTKVKLKVKQGGKTNRFKKKTVKFKKNKKQTKTVKLGLTSTGKKKLSTCGAKTVQVLGKYKRGKKSKTAKKKKKLAKSSKQCDNPPTPPNPPTPEKSTCDPLDPAVCTAALAEQFLHEGSGHQYRSSVGHSGRGDAEEHRGHSNRPDRHQPCRRIQPRQPDRDQDPRGLDPCGL